MLWNYEMQHSDSAKNFDCCDDKFFVDKDTDHARLLLISLLIRIQTMLDCFWFVFIPLTILISNKTVFLVWEMMKTMIKALCDVLMQAVLSVLLLTTANWLVRLWHYCQLWWKVATSGVSLIDFPMSEEKSSCILRWRSIYQLLLKSISWLTYWLLQLQCACTCTQSGNLWMYYFKE